MVIVVAMVTVIIFFIFLSFLQLFGLLVVLGVLDDPVMLLFLLLLLRLEQQVTSVHERLCAGRRPGRGIPGLDMSERHAIISDTTTVVE